MGNLHAHMLKATSVFVSEISRFVLLVKLVETSERWEEGDHTRPLSEHISVSSLCRLVTLSTV